MQNQTDNAPAERPTRFDRNDLMHEIANLCDKVAVLIQMAVNEAKRDNLDVLDTFGFDKASRMFEIMGFQQEMVIDCLREVYNL